MFKKIQNIWFFSVVISFLFVNGIVFIVDSKLGYFDVMHSTILRNIEGSYSINNNSYTNDTDSVVILFSNELFEKEFNSQTPLNKDILAVFIEKILKQKPKNLIFDLDISPDYNFIQQIDNKKEYLYDILVKYSNETNIILPFAFIAQTTENKNLKYKWFKNMCTNNIQFGFPFIFSENGSVLQYKNYNNHISLVSYNNKSKDYICYENIDNFNNFDSIIKKHFHEFSSIKSIPINYQKINDSTILLNDFNQINDFDFKNKTIFIGGGYGFDDKYITPQGEKFGVEILNSIFYTLNHKINHASLLQTVIIFDIILGLSFGTFITFILKKRGNAKFESSITFYNLLLVIIMIIYFIISLNITAYLFHNMYLWINPIPLLLGMFIDAIIGLGNKEIDINKNDKYIFAVYGIKLIFVIFGVYSLLLSI